MTDALLHLRGVDCVRGGRTLFEGLVLDLAPGEAALATGPNGAGKSSLIRIAAGLLPPTAGNVAASARRALMAAEAPALDPELTIARALGFWARIDGVAGDRVAEALEIVGLDHLSAVPVRLLSTGQRRRVALARVIAGGAALWLLDEPGNGLDTTSVAVLESVIARHREQGGAVLLATHLPIALPEAKPIVLGAAR
ncbi:heme ABC exporter ATP-binding protein CcmA [Stakelama marina]|uniref:Heme ABC exporter ATP-binding protein CcmA n=1 Tax=Stakelama marina TaxID=2826939 RepID=A0A8T4IJI0_9SPHN|nr:heme ABC exporter ATP-binding protein CcmA [Stakelama marina]MBR0552499.1 heme ABC exporter ATP-binding protein CcmA [Stakelama marina]